MWQTLSRLHHSVSVPEFRHFWVLHFSAQKSHINQYYWEENQKKNRFLCKLCETQEIASIVFYKSSVNFIGKTIP